MNRRELGKLALGGAALALAGCTSSRSEVSRTVQRCRMSPPEDMLRIDVHAHLLNQDDANAPAFLVRRFLKPKPLEDFFAGNAIGLARRASGVVVRSLQAEARDLAEIKALGPHEPGLFCSEAMRRQHGLVLSDDLAKPVKIGSGRVLGFASNRLRNAAFMMAQWPEVDIFMPLMIDFHEIGPAPPGNHPAVKASFYRMLNVSTEGRFLPLVSFHPQRQYLESRRRARNKAEELPTPLELVRLAVEELGFIGVKVHPTSGFDPWDNRRFGCPNTPQQEQVGLNNDEEEGWQEAMEGLYRLCRELEVPIITHGSDSLTANSGCMQPRRRKDGRYADPLDWTGSSAHWIAALDHLSGGGPGHGLNVCLAHFASRFVQHIPDLRKPVGDYQTPMEFDEENNLIPSAWLKAAVDRIVSDDNSRLWLDLSHMTFLAYSQASMDTDRYPTKVGAFFAYDIQDGGQYAKAFTAFMKKFKALAKRTMYGSDWHMPEVSVIGPAYRELVEAAIPEEMRPDVMGLNAVRFFGLQKGGRNRDRLEKFYEKNGYSASQIRNFRWVSRVDTFA